MRTKLLNVIALAALFLPMQSVAQYGELDPSFGTNGISQGDLGIYLDERVADMVLLPNGQILLASTKFYGSMDFMVQRYNADGTLDATFAGGGEFSFDNAGFADLLSAMALQEDGKVILFGTSVTSPVKTMLTVRMNSDGTLDTGFGNNGSVSVAVPISDTFGNDVAIQSDGKIILAGHTVDGATGNLFFKIIRLNVNGALDGSFGVSGIVSTQNAVITGEYPSCAIQSDGKIVITGIGYSPIGHQHFGLMRLNTNGSYDTDFSSDGIQPIDVSPFYSHQFPEEIAIQPDGKMVVVGFAGVYPTISMTLVRLFTDGELDTTFADHGIREIAPNTVGNILNDVFIQPDGMILACGYTTEPSGGWDWILLRVDADGNLDPTFGTSGVVNTEVTGFDDVAKAVTMQADGKILVAGYTSDSDLNRSTAIARYESGVEVGVREANTQKNISVYPNPSADVFNIKLPSDVKNESLTLRNTLGQVLFSTRVSGTQSQIDLSNLADGVYFLSIDGNAATVTKLIKQ
ncbi:MAG: T9SS type A sorting domain-containing protein [Flavobacteriales bacterium]|nr:T9SS type A sorting domain-containing protein [Flavobacteriales bacterium]